MNTLRPVLGSLTLMLAAAASSAGAQTLVATLPDYSSEFFETGFPIDLGVIGRFEFELPAGATILGASFSGTFGNDDYAFSTAGYNVSLDGGAPITICVFQATCWNDGAPLRPFSWTIGMSEWGRLADGQVDLQITMTSGNFVRLGSPTLTIDYVAAIPEPGAALLMALGLAGVAATRRPRRA